MHNEYQQQEQQQSFYQQEYRPTDTDSIHHTGHIEPVSYNHQEVFPSTLPHNDVRVVAALTYSIGWFSGLLFLLFTRQSRYVRFHSLQALLFFGGIHVLDIMFLVFAFRAHMVFRFFPLAGLLFFGGFMLLNIIAFVGWVVAITQSYRGSYYRLPVVGNIAASILNLGTTLK